MPGEPAGPVSFAEALAQLLANLQPITEATIGYRKQLEAEGYSPTAAEAMSVRMHEAMMAVVVAELAKPR